MADLPQARVHAWKEIIEDHPMEKIARKRIIGEKIMISRVQLDRGFEVPSHQHENEQFAVVIEGEMEFGLEGSNGHGRRTIIVRAGEVLEIPAHVPHSARALRDSLLLDVFSPPSEKTGVDRS